MFGTFMNRKPPQFPKGNSLKIFKELPLDFPNVPGKDLHSSRAIQMQHHIISFMKMKVVDESKVGFSYQIEVWALNLETLKWIELKLLNSEVVFDDYFNLCAYRDKIVILGLDKKEKDPKKIRLEVLTIDFESKSCILSKN